MPPPSALAYWRKVFNKAGDSEEQLDVSCYIFTRINHRLKRHYIRFRQMSGRHFVTTSVNVLTIA